MYCIKCGKRISKEMDFCPKCGTPIDFKLYEDEINNNKDNDVLIETNETEELIIENTGQNHEEDNKSYDNPENEDLNKDEYYVSFIDALMDDEEGTLFLTSQRLFFKSYKKEGFLWGCYLSDIVSHNLEDKDGAYSLSITTNHLNQLFYIILKKRKTIISFYEMFQRVKNKCLRNEDILLDEIGIEEDDSTSNNYTIEYDDESSNLTRESQYQQKKVKYPWALALGMILVVAVGIFIFTRMGSPGSSESDLDGKYYLYRNTVFHQIDGVIEIKNGEFKKSHGNMVFDSGKYNYDEDSEILHLGKLNFKVAREDGEVKALEKITADEVPVGAEIYYKQ